MNGLSEIEIFVVFLQKQVSEMIKFLGKSFLENLNNHICALPEFSIGGKAFRTVSHLLDYPLDIFILSLF